MSLNLEAERATLGAILQDGGMLDDVRSLLRVDDFAALEHRQIYTAMLALTAAGIPLDVATLADRLPKLVAVLATIVGDAPVASRAEYYARAVLEHATVRRLLAAAERVGAMARDGVDSPTLLSELSREMDECRHSNGGAVHISEVCRAVEAEVTARSKGELPPPGVPTGLAVIDEALTFRGLPKKHITVFGGATSAGKSALATTAILGASKEGLACLAVSLEDEAEVIVKRSLARLTRLSNTTLQRGEIGLYDRQAFEAGLDELARRDIWFLSRSVRKVEDIALEVRRHSREHRLDLVVVDFLQLVGTQENTRTTQDRVDRVMGAFVDLSTSIDAATLIVSQLKRTGEEEPTKEALYHSGAIEQWSHTIGLLWRAPVDVKRCVSLILDKQKNGPTGRYVLGWDASLCAFRDPDPDDRVAYTLAVDGLTKREGKRK